MRRILTGLITGVVLGLLTGFYFGGISSMSSLSPDGKMISESGGVFGSGWVSVFLVTIITSIIVCVIAYFIKNKILTLIMSALAGGCVMLVFSIWSGMYLQGAIAGVIFGSLIGGMIIIVDMVVESRKSIKNME